MTTLDAMTSYLASRGVRASRTQFLGGSIAVMPLFPTNIGEKIEVFDRAWHVAEVDGSWLVMSLPPSAMQPDEVSCLDLSAACDLVLDRLVMAQKWVGPAPLSEAALRQSYPAGAFRIAVHEYPPATRFVRRQRACRTYVLRGTCRMGIEGRTCTVSEGEFSDFFHADYEFEVLGEKACRVVKVWDLRDLQPEAP